MAVAIHSQQFIVDKEREKRKRKEECFNVSEGRISYQCSWLLFLPTFYVASSWHCKAEY